MGGSSSRSDIINTANILIAKAYLDSTQECQQTINLVQQDTFTCDPEVAAGTDYYEDNAACVECYNNIIKVQENDYIGLKRLWPNNHISSGLNLNASAIDVSKVFSSCSNVCKACKWTNITQNSNISFESDCKFTESMVNSMSQNIQGSFSQVLTNNQDILSSLTQALGSSSNTENIINLVNSVTSSFSAKLMAQAAEKVKSIQIQKFFGQGGAQHKVATQDASIKILQTFISDTNIVNNLLTDTQWDVYQQIKNDQNTLDELGSAVSKATLTVGNVVNSITGTVMISVMIIVAVIVVAVILIGMIRAIKAST
jgi:hypothetical protein